MTRERDVYLIDTDVISEARKKEKAHPGVQRLFMRAEEQRIPSYLSVVTVGELRRGIEIIRHRNDVAQATVLEVWLKKILKEYEDCILSFDAETAQMWGRLRVPRHENALDKQIAATAIMHDLTLVTRNEEHFKGTGVRILNPFTEIGTERRGRGSRI